LENLTPAQWEALCDGCGRCCLHKLQDAASGRVVTTLVACRLLDRDRCRCRHYAERLGRVPECVRLTPATVRRLTWLPASCAYRRTAEGRGLADWHPLVSGTPDSVHAAGISVRGIALSASDVHPDDWPSLAIDWNEAPA
jgi:uncharacterized cysteine cluster protein YcgN (CxxCxxCC family)